MKLTDYEYYGWRAGESAYDNLSAYRKYECGPSWRDNRQVWHVFHSMQAATMEYNDVTFFKSYAYVACAYRPKDGTLFVDDECLRKSRTTNRQLARFLNEYVSRNVGLRSIEEAITDYTDATYNGEVNDYALNGFDTIQYDVMSYLNIVVVDGLGYQFGV